MRISIVIILCTWAVLLVAQEPDVFPGGLLFEDDRYAGLPRMAA